MTVRTARALRLKYETREPADVRPPVANPQAGERRFYLGSGLAAFAVVIIGFGHTAYLRRTSGRPGLNVLVMAHATLMAGWYVLFLLQAALIRVQRTVLHRRLGWAVAAWALVMVVVGADTMWIRAGKGPVTVQALTGNPDSTYWLFTMLLTFSVLVGAAIVMRKRRDYHKRFMLLACFGLMAAGSSRLPLAAVPSLNFLQSGGPTGIFGLDLLMVYACVAWDTWRNRRLHPAFVLGTLAIVMQDTIMLKTAGWIRLATILHLLG